MQSPLQCSRAIGDHALRQPFVELVEIGVPVLLAAFDKGFVADDEHIHLAHHQRQDGFGPCELLREFGAVHLGEGDAVIGVFERQDRLVAAIAGVENCLHRAVFGGGAAIELRHRQEQADPPGISLFEVAIIDVLEMLVVVRPERPLRQRRAGRAEQRRAEYQ